jgi:hypothetical protein
MVVGVEVVATSLMVVVEDVASLTEVVAVDGWLWNLALAVLGAVKT